MNLLLGFYRPAGSAEVLRLWRNKCSIQCSCGIELVSWKTGLMMPISFTHYCLGWGEDRRRKLKNTVEITPWISRW